MVEIIPKETPKLSTGLNALFYFSLFLLFLSIISYFVLNNSLKKSQEEVSALEMALIEQSSPERISLEKEVLMSQNRIDKFSSLINQHLRASKIFELVQGISHPQVWFSKFDLNSRQGTLRVSGSTQSYETLGQQMLILTAEKIIDKASLESFSMTKEGKIDFDLSLSFSPDILK